jgi:hypothetical protein
MAECQEEVGRFVSDRLAKDGEALRQSLTCRDWTEAVDVQARWFEETLRDYNTEMRKLTELFSNATSPAVQDNRRAA